MNPKKLGKSFICFILEAQVKRLRRKNSFILIAVAGSVGKTSTKLAIAKTLNQKLTVRYQDGNYNDRLTVPLIIFGKNEPNIYNIFGWLSIILTNEWNLRRKYAYDLAIVELGPDGPGQMAAFSYLKPDLVVLTAIAHEHMEFFKDLDQVAKEEILPLSYSKDALVNLDNIPAQYLPETSFKTYGTMGISDYQLVKSEPVSLTAQNIEISLPDKTNLIIQAKLAGAQGAMALTAATAVAHILKQPLDEIKQELERLTPASGRMQILAGVNDTQIIDDTYNASPTAVKAALDVLYSAAASQRIAILGSMNELGSLSAKDHQEIGEYCDPKKLDLVITIGSEASKYLAAKAKLNGCQVASFTNPYKAGQYAKEHLLPGTLILVKGSQNGVFAEEAVKVLLRDHKDEAKLVRQTKYWLNLKQKQLTN